MLQRRWSGEDENKEKKSTGSLNKKENSEIQLLQFMQTSFLH